MFEGSAAAAVVGVLSRAEFVTVRVAECARSALALPSFAINCAFNFAVLSLIAIVDLAVGVVGCALGGENWKSFVSAVGSPEGARSKVEKAPPPPRRPHLAHHLLEEPSATSDSA